MTQLSTIAYERPAPSALTTPMVIVAIAVALAVGLGLGLLASNIDVTMALGPREVSASTHEEFLRMNTEDLDHLAPMGLVPSVTLATSATDPFMVSNVESYEWIDEAIAARQAVGAHFYEINTAAIGTSVSDSADSAASVTDIIGNSEPAGHPNYGRLQTYLGAAPESGVR